MHLITAPAKALGAQVKALGAQRKALGLQAKATASRVKDDTGMITIELAIGIATFIAVLLMAVAALASIGAYISAIDTAGAAARAYAVGQSYTPKKGEIHVREDDGMVYVTAKIPAVVGSMQATAIYPKQQPGT